jgi:hypothetical protein
VYYWVCGFDWKTDGGAGACPLRCQELNRGANAMLLLHLQQRNGCPEKVEVKTSLTTWGTIN